MCAGLDGRRPQSAMRATGRGDWWSRKCRSPWRRCGYGGSAHSDGLRCAPLLAFPSSHLTGPMRAGVAGRRGRGGGSRWWCRGRYRAQWGGGCRGRRGIRPPALVPWWCQASSSTTSSLMVLRQGCRDSGKISGQETPCSSVVAQEREFSFGPFRKTCGAVTGGLKAGAQLLGRRAGGLERHRRAAARLQAQAHD
ncbi:uncharacterized protein LOC120707027 isoform X2 [Panicum virgatum]|uniref:uncharacterized protein LOC120707027 isoform X2 n=1 Tax=Panicum virgatum TaxID=38727 RepID=UPI0019D52CAD|nr:uncharacterized protein LOC120707027 isoform X2 [Panicum virgatum]